MESTGNKKNYNSKIASLEHIRLTVTVIMEKKLKKPTCFVFITRIGRQRVFFKCEDPGADALLGFCKRSEQNSSIYIYIYIEWIIYRLIHVLTV